MKATINVFCYKSKTQKYFLYEIKGVGEVIVHKFWYFFNFIDLKQ